jgi:Zinc knuckle
VKKCNELFGVSHNRIVVDHYQFNNRNQAKSEKLTDYALELQSIAEHCDFGNFRDFALRDRFVAGIRNKHTRVALMSLDDKKSYSEIVECAKKEEMIYNEACNISSAKKESNVDFVTNPRYQRNGNQVEKNFKGRLGPQRDRSGVKNDCRRDNLCFNCHETGHFARQCNKANGGISYTRQPGASTSRGASRERSRTRERSVPSNVNALGSLLELRDISTEELINRMDTEGEFKSEIQKTKLCVNNVLMEFECDTGSKFTLCSVHRFRKLFAGLKVEPCSQPLTVISGERFRVLGECKAKVMVRQIEYDLRMLVLDTSKDFIPLLSREWLDVLNPKWREAFKVNKMNFDVRLDELRKRVLTEIKRDFLKVFDGDMTEPIRDIRINVRMSPDAKPFVHKAYDVPFSLRQAVEKHIDKNVSEGVWKKCEYTDWASPMVTLRKPNGDLRCCLDGSRTINPHLEMHHYPIPRIDELLATKSKAKCFVVLDMRGAYTQLMMSEESKKLLTVNTIKGLYRYERMPFGLKPAAQIFQQQIDFILQGIEGVQAYINWWNFK